MTRYLLMALTCGLLLACVRSGLPVEPDTEQAKALAEIEKVGGNVTVDENRPGKPVIGVYLFKTKADDAALLHIGGLR